MRGGLVGRIAGGAILLGLLLAAVFAALLVTIDSRRSAVDVARGSAAVVTSSFEAQKLVVDSETGVRGFLLTRDQRFLAPHASAVRELPGRLDELERSVRDDPAQLRRAGDIGQAISAYLSEWAQPAVDAPPRMSIRATLADGKRRVDDIRTRFDRFNTVQRRVAERETAHADDLATLALVLGGGGALAALVLMGLFAAYGARMVAPVRRVARAAHSVAGGDLDARVDVAGGAEVAELSHAFNQMAGALQEGRDELESQNAELEAQQNELQDLLDEVAREKARVERIHDFAQTLAGHTEIEPLGDAMLEYLRADAGADVGALYVHNDVRGAYELLATLGVPADRLAPAVTEGEGIAGRALSERRPVAAATGDCGLPIAVLGGEQPARHQLSVPLLQGERRAGLVTLARVADRPFSASEIAAAELLADQAAVSVARARLQRATARSLRTVQAVLDATPDPIALVGPDGAVLFENWPMADLRAQHADDEAAGRAFDVRGAEVSRQARDELALEGGRRVLARYAAPLVGEGATIIGRIVVLRDVSAEREAERMKDEFFALVSHELRTPLTSIIGYLELALEEDDGDAPLDATRRQFLDVIDRNAKRLLRLVGDLLFVAQVEAGTLTLARGPVDLARVARDAVEAAGPRASASGLELRLEAPEELHAAAADRDRVGQMLDNLIVNACKFTPPGGSVSVRLDEIDGDAQLAVSDTGAGIAPADQARLFERFYRAREAAERGVPGVGLGLTIVHAIVRGHGGEIAVESAPGAGTTFRVRLPLVDVAGVSASAAPARAGAAPED